jgi:myo-inositol-1(or 4)-monophosphatase
VVDPRLTATAVEGALLVGRIHRRYFRQPFAIAKKRLTDLVTTADLEAERAFRTLIATRFPGHDVLGEEGTAGARDSLQARHRWIVDPLDGTTNFAHGLALFSVSIALEIDGQVEVGVVFDPIGRELFVAERGGGARLNGMPIHVTKCETLVDAVLATGFPYTVREERRRQVDVFAVLLEEARAVRRLGSAALDLCYVACGRFDGYWEDKLNCWDIAAGALVVGEAGGVVTGISGQPLDPYAGHIVASTPSLHSALLAGVARGRRDHSE